MLRRFITALCAVVGTAKDTMTEVGQTTAEYALVILGAAAIGTLVITCADASHAPTPVWRRCRRVSSPSRRCRIDRTRPHNLTDGSGAPGSSKVDMTKWPAGSERPTHEPGMARSACWAWARNPSRSPVCREGEKASPAARAKCMSISLSTSAASVRALLAMALRRDFRSLCANC